MLAILECIDPRSDRSDMLVRRVEQLRPASFADTAVHGACLLVRQGIPPLRAMGRRSLRVAPDFVSGPELACPHPSDIIPFRGTT